MNTDFFNFKFYDIPAALKTEITGPDRSAYLCILAENDYADNQLLLSKIFAAVGKDMENDIQKVILPEEATSRLQDYVTDETELIFSFGLEPRQLSLNGRFQAYHIYHFENFKFLRCNALSELSTDKFQKNKLWNQLKKLFNK